jgi:urease accessory protein
LQADKHTHPHDHNRDHHNDSEHAYEVEPSQHGAHTMVADPAHVHRDEFDPITRGARQPLRIGVGGPVGSGKTALVAALCRSLAKELRMAVVTNDIYTTEDADFLLKNGVIDADHVTAVETGSCPHTAIRDDISTNLEALEELEARHPDLDLVLLESGGDNLTATFSRGLVHQQIFVIDVAGGDKVPRKGGPGTATSDLLMINKTDLAPMVGADLAVMDRDARAKRKDLPFVFTSLTEDPGAAKVVEWVRAKVAEHAGHAAA